MSDLRAALVVGLGGFLGSAGRFLVAGWLHRLRPETTFPVGTLGVNVLGSLLIGVMAGLLEIRQLLSPDARLFLMLGLLGGFTTFSSFAYETLELVRNGDLARAGLNVLAQLLLGLGAAWAGYAAVVGHLPE